MVPSALTTMSFVPGDAGCKLTKNRTPVICASSAMTPTGFTDVKAGKVVATDQVVPLVEDRQVDVDVVPTTFIATKRLRTLDHTTEEYVPPT